MLAVVGTIPEDDFPLLCGRAEISPSGLRVEGKDIDVNRGTPALLAAACLMLQTLGREPPLAFLADERPPILSTPGDSSCPRRTRCPV